MQALKQSDSECHQQLDFLSRALADLSEARRGSRQMRDVVMELHIWMVRYEDVDVANKMMIWNFTQQWQTA